MLGFKQFLLENDEHNNFDPEVQSLIKEYGYKVSARAPRKYHDILSNHGFKHIHGQDNKKQPDEWNSKEKWQPSAFQLHRYLHPKHNTEIILSNPIIGTEQSPISWSHLNIIPKGKLPNFPTDKHGKGNSPESLKKHLDTWKPNWENVPINKQKRRDLQLTQFPPTNKGSNKIN